MSFVATFVLVCILVLRPQEIWPFLTVFRLLDVFTGLALLGVGYDFMSRKQTRFYTPALPWLAVFVLWTYFASLVMLGRDGLPLATTNASIAAIFMLVVTFGTRSLERLRMLLALLIACALFVSVVAVQQGRQEPECIEVSAETQDNVEDEGVPDGRDCETKHECEIGGRGDVDYLCEKMGWFNTVSVERRVRWRGQLADPNELAVYIGAVFPLLIALLAASKKWWQTALGVTMLIAPGLYAIILTQSRGGQLVVATVFTVYFVSRFGWKGVFGGAIFAVPVILLGGRSSEAATASADERSGLMYDAVTDALHYPFFGLGFQRFVEEHGHTTHNAYLLAAVDLGLPGFYLWAGLVWASVKVPLAVVRRPPPGLDPGVKDLAKAILVSWLGMLVGIFFLSFTYKQIFFVWLGCCGALYGAVKDKHPEFDVSYGKKDFLVPAGFVGMIMTATYIYTRLHPN